MAKSVPSPSANEKSAGLSNSDLPKRKSESRISSVDRTLLVPSIIADSHLNRISESKSDTEKETSDNEEEVLQENGDISMSENVDDSRDISTGSETTVVEDDEITFNHQVDAADVTATQEVLHDDVAGVGKKRQRKPRFVLHSLTSNSSPTQSELSIDSSSKTDDVAPVEILIASPETGSPEIQSTDLLKSQSRRKLSRTHITKVASMHTETNGDSKDLTKLDINDKAEDIEAFKTIETRLVDQTSNESDSRIVNGKSETPSLLPQPVSIKQRGRKRKRFESDLSLSGSGFSASSSRDPSPNQKVG